MENIEISKYLTDYNRPTNCGKCRSCDKPVQWTKERLASHKRSSCPNASAEEKRLFAKRKRELSSLPSTSVQDQITQPIQVSQELLTLNGNAMNAELKADTDLKLANFFYRTGISLRLVESEAFKDFVKALNPIYASAMPNAKSLSGSLLDKHFNKCSAAVDEIIESHENLTLISDGWTNVRGDHIVNFCVKAPGQKAFFYESIDTSGIIQNSTAVAAAIFDVIEKIGSHKFICFISDNAPVMKAAWKLIEVKFPHISASGCAAHGMNLLIKDITSTTESAKTIKESEKIIKFIKNHHLVKAMFDERRLAANVLSSLCLPVPTRWYSLFNSMNNLLVSKYVLIKLADEKYDELKDMQPKSTSAAVLTLLKSNAFWDRLAKLVKDIEFPSNIIGKLESDDAPLSLVYDYFGQLYNYYENDEAIQLKVMSRLKFIFTPSMGLAFLLTPKHAADGFYFEENKLDFIAAAYDQAIKVNPEIADNVHLQMIEFTGEMATLTQKRKDTLFKMSAKNYWNIIGREKYPALAQIAKPITEMICTSAAAERTWSTFGFIHSRLRNRLTNERVKKLVFLYTNNVLMDVRDKNDYIIDEGELLNENECEFAE